MINLQYNYAQLNVETGECVGVLTSSYVINHEAYVQIPEANNEYRGKFYNRENELWYYEPEFITEFNP